MSIERTLKVMVSGLTNREDVEHAIKAGADAIVFGFNPRDPRFVQMHVVRDILQAVDTSKIEVHAALADEKEFVIEKIEKETGIRKFIFKGAETPDFCNKYAGRYIRGLRLMSPADLVSASKFSCEQFLVDLKYIHEVEHARKMSEIADVYISGLITEENILSLIEDVGPYGIDLNEILESSFSKKDPDKISAYVGELKRVRFYEQSVGFEQ